MGWLSPGKERHVRKPEERVADARDALARATARAGREVLAAARDHVKIKVPPAKRAVALALLDQSAAYLRDGRESDACAAVGKALGKAWERKLRTAIAPRVVRPHQGKRTSKSAPIPPMPEPSEG